MTENTEENTEEGPPPAGERNSAEHDRDNVLPHLVTAGDDEHDRDDRADDRSDDRARRTERARGLARLPHVLDGDPDAIRREPGFVEGVSGLDRALVIGERGDDRLLFERLVDRPHG